MEIRARLDAALGDRYRVERELGQGGMAVVFLAHDAKHRRQVAVKVLRPELALAVGAERFLREIEIAAGLNHPNILALHDSGASDGLLYYVMPYVDGDSLRGRLDRDGPLPLPEAGRIVREVGGALEYAHARGLIHRDVKPENVLFQAGHALVCDFGIAMVVSEAQERLTRTGMAVGTLSYMSPEQMAEGAAVDARTDVFALGCLLHEMLTGRPPFDASTPQAALAKKLVGEIPEVTGARPDVPHTVDAVVRRALATAPEDRYASAERLVLALEHATTEGAVAADARRRRLGVAGRIAAGLVALAAIGLGGRWLSGRVGGPTIERVAVLPSPDFAAEPGQEYFVQGVYQDLSLELAKAGLRVKSPNSAARFAASSASIRAIADSLGVDGVIHVAAALTPDGRAKIDVMLVDGESEDVLWAGGFQGEERHILSLYGEVTKAIADEVGVRLDDEALRRLAAAPEVDAAVFEALRNARYHWQQLTEEGHDNALRYYELAIELDSTSAEAWNGVAQVTEFRAQQGLLSAEEAVRRAAPARARAEALDPTLAQLQATVALRRTWLEWAYEDAERAFRLALDGNPLDAATRAYFGLLLLYLDRVDEAEQEIARAAETDPYNTLVQGLRAQYLNARGRYAEAEEALVGALARDPNAPFLLSTLRTTYHLLGREEEALDMWRASFTPEGSYAAGGDPEALAALERGHDAGGYGGALGAVADLYVERSATRRVAPWQIGTLYARAGRTEEALDYLERAVAERDPNSPYLSVDRIFDPLRGDPRFAALIDRVGLAR